MNVTTFYIANVSQDDIADVLDEHGVSATLTPCTGIGQWGKEPTTAVMVATGPKLGGVIGRIVANEILTPHGESCALVVCNGWATLLYADGMFRSLTDPTR